MHGMGVYFIAKMLTWNSKWWPQGGPSIPLKWFWIICVVVGGLLALRFGIIYARRAYRRLEPLRIYSRIASKMGLNVDDRYLLWRVARQTGLANPLSLLICSDTLDAHGRRYAAALGGSASRAAERRIERIQKRIFTEAATRAQSK